MDHCSPGDEASEHIFVAPIMTITLLIGLPELWHCWKTRKTPEGPAYYDLPLLQLVAVGVV
jgi:hypothetical protein